MAIFNVRCLTNQDFFTTTTTTTAETTEDCEFTFMGISFTLPAFRRAE